MGSDHFSEKKIRTIEKKLGKLKQKPGSSLRLLDHSDFLQLFSISSRTSHSWRARRRIAHYKIGKKLFFSIPDIEEFLNKHLRK